MEEKICHNDVQDISSKDILGIEKEKTDQLPFTTTPQKEVQEIISQFDKTTTQLQTEIASMNREDSLGFVTREYLHRIGFDFTGNMIQGHQRYIETNSKKKFSNSHYEENRTKFRYLRSPNHSKTLRKVNKRWKTVSFNHPSTKVEVVSILQSSTASNYRTVKLGEKIPTLGGRVYKHSRLTIIDIDAHPSKEKNVEQVDNVAVLTRVIELLDCSKACYVETSMERNEEQRGFHLYLKTSDYVWSKTWNNLISIIRKEFGITIEVFNKDTTRSVRFPFDWGYQFAGPFMLDPKKREELGRVIPLGEGKRTLKKCPIVPLVSSALEALVYIDEMPETSIPKSLIFHNFTYGARTAIKREVARATDKPRQFKNDPSSMYSYGEGTRWRNQISIGFACIRRGMDFSDFTSECHSANRGSKDMASGSADRILESIWNFCESHYRDQNGHASERRILSESNRTDQKYKWRSRELSEDEDQLFRLLFDNQILPRLNYKPTTQKSYQIDMYRNAQSLYSFLLQEHEFTIKEQKRIYVDNRLAHLSDYVDVSMKELQAFCKEKELPFETLKRLLKIFEEVGLVHVGLDAYGRRYKKGHFCTHYKLIPIFYLVKRSMKMEAPVQNRKSLFDRLRLQNTISSLPAKESYGVDRNRIERNTLCLVPPPHNIDEKGTYLLPMNPGKSFYGLSPPKRESRQMSSVGDPGNLTSYGEKSWTLRKMVSLGHRCVLYFYHTGDVYDKRGIV